MNKGTRGWPERTWRALDDHLGKRVGPFGEKGVYELTNIFSFQSTFGLSYRRDIEATSGSGAAALDGGYIKLTTGTTSGSTSRIDTVERGQYQPGKGAETGIAVFLPTPPTGDGVAEWGLGDGDNGAFFRYKGDGTLNIVYEVGDSETEVAEANLNGDDLSDFDPTAEAAVYVIRFNWYGVGGAEYWLYRADAASNGTLEERLVHRFAPAQGQAFVDPNLPIFANVDNGTTTTDVTLEFGGRRYDIQGRFNPERRRSGDYRVNQTVTATGNPLTPLVSARRKAEFPEAGRQNSVNVFIDAFSVESDQDLILWMASVDDLADLTGESFGVPSQHNDAETAIETDTSATGISNLNLVAGPYFISGGAKNNTENISKTKGERVPFVGTNPTCLVAIAPGGTDATVSSVLRIVEEW